MLFSGSNADKALDLALDGEGQVYLAGFTRSDDFPLANPIQAARSGATCGGSATSGSEFCSDAYGSKLDLSSNSLPFSS